MYLKLPLKDDNNMELPLCSIYSATFVRIIKRKENIISESGKDKLTRLCASIYFRPWCRFYRIDDETYIKVDQGISLSLFAQKNQVTEYYDT